MSVISCRVCEKTKINGCLFLHAGDSTCICGSCAEAELTRLMKENEEFKQAMNEAKESLDDSKCVDQSDDILIPLGILEKELRSIENG